jgi:hypothetical protein
MASVALRRRKSLLGEGEEEQGRGPHRWANGADVEELRSGSSEALGGCDGGELGWTESSRLPARKKATASALCRPAMVARK